MAIGGNVIFTGTFEDGSYWVKDQQTGAYQKTASFKQNEDGSWDWADAGGAPIKTGVNEPPNEGEWSAAWSSAGTATDMSEIQEHNTQIGIDAEETEEEAQSAQNPEMDFIASGFGAEWNSETSQYEVNGKKWTPEWSQLEPYKTDPKSAEAIAGFEKSIGKMGKEAKGLLQMVKEDRPGGAAERKEIETAYGDISTEAELAGAKAEEKLAATGAESESLGGLMGAHLTRQATETKLKTGQDITSRRKSEYQSGIQQWTGMQQNILSGKQSLYSMASAEAQKAQNIKEANLALVNQMAGQAINLGDEETGGTYEEYTNLNFGMELQTDDVWQATGNNPWAGSAGSYVDEEGTAMSDAFVQGYGVIEGQRMEWDEIVAKYYGEGS